MGLPFQGPELCDAQEASVKEKKVLWPSIKDSFVSFNSVRHILKIKVNLTKSKELSFIHPFTQQLLSND